MSSGRAQFADRKGDPQRGKVRAKLRIPPDASKEAIQARAESDAQVQGHLAGKPIVKVVVVPGKMVNFVVKG